MRKAVINIIKQIVISAIVLVIMIGGFFGAVLQTSYRLSPVTEMEVIEGK
jgi:hypothetical protein